MEKVGALNGTDQKGKVVSLNETEGVKNNHIELITIIMNI